MTSLDQLAAIGSQALSTTQPDLRWAVERGVWSILAHELATLLSTKNGFFAFESALLVLPSQSEGGIVGLAEWNEARGWISAWDRIPKSAVFFAQDAFAGQYGVSDSSVIHLEPETGELTLYEGSLENWARTVLEDYDLETGWSVARDWQARQGPLRPGDRLLPKRPFVLGGDYVPDNLVAVDAPIAMRKLGKLYRQIRDVPDGVTLTVKGWDVGKP